MEGIKNPSGTSLLVPSVQELSKDGMISTVPPRYIQPNHEDLVLSEVNTNLEIPVIDMHNLLSEEFGSSELAKLHDACKDWGFFQVYFFYIFVKNIKIIYHDHFYDKCFYYKQKKKN